MKLLSPRLMTTLFEREEEESTESEDEGADKTKPVMLMHRRKNVDTLHNQQQITIGLVIDQINT